MGLQKFKMNIANTVVTHDNASLASMGTDQLLDLFQVSAQSAGSSSVGDTDEAGGGDSLMGAAARVLGELWDESQYESEFSLQSFMDAVSEARATK